MLSWLTSLLPYNALHFRCRGQTTRFRFGSCEENRHRSGVLDVRCAEKICLLTSSLKSSSNPMGLFSSRETCIRLATLGAVCGCCVVGFRCRFRAEDMLSSPSFHPRCPCCWRCSPQSRATTRAHERASSTTTVGGASHVPCAHYCTR